MTTRIPLLRDDSAAHQIRIEYGRRMELVVSCTCLQRNAPSAYLSSIRDAFEATKIWREHWARALSTGPAGCLSRRLTCDTNSRTMPGETREYVEHA